MTSTAAAPWMLAAQDHHFDLGQVRQAVAAVEPPQGGRQAALGDNRDRQAAFGHRQPDEVLALLITALAAARLSMLATVASGVASLALLHYLFNQGL